MEKSNCPELMIWSAPIGGRCRPSLLRSAAALWITAREIRPTPRAGHSKDSILYPQCTRSAASRRPYDTHGSLSSWRRTRAGIALAFPNRRSGTQSVTYRLKLSPQPHSLLAFGLWNTQAVFKPWDAKSISSPRRESSFSEGTMTLTPWTS